MLDLFRGAYRKGEEGRISLLVQNHLRCPVGPTASRLDLVGASVCLWGLISESLARKSQSQQGWVPSPSSSPSPRL